MRGRTLISRYLCRVGLLAGALFYCLTTTAAPAPTADLGKVQGQIKEQQKTVKLGKQELAKLAEQLRSDEQAVSSAAAKLSDTQTQLKQSEARIQTLTREKQELERQATRQKAMLARQAQSAFISGEHDYLKMLLNQQDPNRISRTLDFYAYFNKARIESIEALRTTQQKITANQKASEETLARQQALLDDQKQQHQSLLASQQSREKTRQQLQQDVQSDEAKLGRLLKAEKKLKARLEELRRQQEEAERREQERLAKIKAEKERLRKQAEHAKQDEARELARQQKQLDQEETATRRYSSGLSTSARLNWPVQGPILISYGTRRTAELKWKGTLIGAAEGAQVKAVAPGKVVYADWLDGFGMLLVIDHGKGYMSLYGHNQSLLRKVGQKVEQGEPVALVGNSGGQDQTGLYFEIRYQGEAINPAKWLARGG